MSLYCKIRNDALICELKNELNSDIVLMGADGFVYFGHLQSIEDCRLAILTPAICAKTCDVEIITPGGCMVTVDFVRVDLWSIVGKGLGVVRDPVYQLSSCDAICNDENCNDGKACGTSGFCGKCGCREEKSEEEPAILPGQERDYDCLTRQIKRMIGNNIALTTVGGFLFEGILSDVCNNLAIITIDEIFIPGCSGYIDSCNLRSAVVNLEAISSVAGGRTRC